MIFPSKGLFRMARDRQGFGRHQGGRGITAVLTTSSKLASGVGCELRSGAHGGLALIGFEGELSDSLFE